MLKWLKRIVVTILALLTLVLLSGLAFEQFSRWSSYRDHPPPGQLVAIDGRDMHLHCTGTGSPTVVLEAGWLSHSSLQWVLVQPEISKTTRVCSYDRAGMLWSESIEEEPSAIQIVDRLHKLLETASESPPVIMVGHSMGGLIIMAYAHRYPDEVQGMVFVDSSHPEQDERLASLYGEETEEESYLVDRLLTEIGVTRLTLRNEVNSYPNEAEAAQELLPQSIASGIRESDAWSQINTEAGMAKSFGDIPLIVLTAHQDDFGLTPEEVAEYDPDEVKLWREADRLSSIMQVEIAELSTNGVQRTVDGSGHLMPFDDPDVVVEAITEVVLRVRASE